MPPPTVVRRHAPEVYRRTPDRRRVDVVLQHPATWLSLICSLPVLVSAFRTIAGGWTPEGDDARVTTRIRSVLTGNPPLLGMRSTSGDGNRALDTHHPGPLQFYLDAPFSAIFNYSAAGIVIAVAVVNLACIVGVVLLAHRMRGLRTAIPVGGALLLAQWALGADVLARPLNPSTAIMPILLMLVATWSVLDRDRNGLWVALLAGSYAAQAELAFCPLVIAACGTAVVAVACRAWANRFSRSPVAGGLRAPQRRTMAITALVVIVWLPSIIELVALHPNNVELLIRYAGDSGSEGATTSTGVAGGFEYVVGNLSPTQFSRFDTSIAAAPSGTGIAVGLFVLVLLVVALGAGPRLPRTAATRGCWVVLIAVVAESVALSAKPDSGPGTFWLLPVLVIPSLAYAALVIRCIELLRSASMPDRISTVLSRWSPRSTITAALASGVAAALIASLTARPPALANSERAHAVTAAVLSYLESRGKPHTPVEVDSTGLQAWITLSPAVGFQLLRHGYPAHFMIDWSYPEDTSRWNVSSAPPGSILVTLADESAAPGVKLRPGAVPIPLPVDVAAGTHLWIDIPPGDRS